MLSTDHDQALAFNARAHVANASASLRRMSAAPEPQRGNVLELLADVDLALRILQGHADPPTEPADVLVERKRCGPFELIEGGR